MGPAHSRTRQGSSIRWLFGPRTQAAPPPITLGDAPFVFSSPPPVVCVAIVSLAARVFEGWRSHTCFFSLPRWGFCIRVNSTPPLILLHLLIVHVELALPALNLRCAPLPTPPPALPDLPILPRCRPCGSLTPKVSARLICWLLPRALRPPSIQGRILNQARRRCRMGAACRNATTLQKPKLPAPCHPLQSGVGSGCRALYTREKPS